MGTPIPDHTQVVQYEISVFKMKVVVFLALALFCGLIKCEITAPVADVTTDSVKSDEPAPLEQAEPAVENEDDEEEEADQEDEDEDVEDEAEDDDEDEEQDENEAEDEPMTDDEKAKKKKDQEKDVYIYNFMNQHSKSKAMDKVMPKRGKSNGDETKPGHFI